MKGKEAKERREKKQHSEKIGWRNKATTTTTTASTTTTTKGCHRWEKKEKEQRPESKLNK